ncbi:flagellar basal body-associated FliL family protein [Neobacillus muris]|uniref:flagellar basal body-associated FliL family protein n=1 Tax=Neobacillus muris TaxID=2941334 RepID=UPI0020426505|nr:flagellar basal body-associated FliL family protein [Neobacillus muris]
MKLYIKSIVIIGIITVAGLGGYFGWEYFQKPKDAEAKESPSAEELLAMSVDTESITTNFKDGGFIKTKFKLITTSKDKAEELKKLEFRIESTIIQYINEVDKENVNGPDGIISLEDNLKTELNKELGDDSITKVYMIEKIIQ